MNSATQIRCVYAHTVYNELMNGELEHISVEQLNKQAAVLREQVDTLRSQLAINETRLKAVNQLIHAIGGTSASRDTPKRDAGLFSLEATPAQDLPVAYTDHVREACLQTFKAKPSGFYAKDIREWISVNLPNIEVKTGTIGNALQNMLDRDELHAARQGRKGMPTLYQLGPRFDDYRRKHS